ncbi:MAG TPA: Ig-like domain-containing protein [Thermoanaerobaculia bacterium]|nr:Ig-like domain-containing protein [Thermoanaerobaculia bacterium]
MVSLRGRMYLPAAVLPVLLFCAFTASAATVSWNNAAGGNWGTAANWSPAQVPTSGDEVSITLPGTYTVTVNVAASANTLTVGNATGTQTLSIPGNSLTLGGPSSVADGGVLNLSAGSLGGGGALTISSTFDWTGGTIGGSGPLIIDPGAALNIGGSADKFFVGKTVNNNGTLLWTQGRILFQNSSVVNNNAAGLFDIRSDSTITSTSGGGTINNAGTLRKQVAAGTTTIVQFITLANTGVIDVLTGVLTTLSASLGTGTNITGTGYLVNGGTVSVTGDATVNGTMGVASGDLAGPGILTVNGILNWTGGSFAGNGSVDVSGTGTLAISGGADHFLSIRTINNAGDILWTQGRILFQNNGQVNNLASGTFDIQVDESMTSTSVGGSINNDGLIQKTGGPGTTTAAIYVHLNNFGTIHVPSGSLTFQDANLNDGTQITGTGYVMTGTTTVTGTATVVGAATFPSGTLDGAGTLSVNGILDWNGGSMADAAGTTLVPDGGLLRLGGGADKFLDRRTIENHGATLWTAGRLLFQNSGLFINHLDGLFETTHDGSFTSTSVGGAFRNFGTYRKSGGAGSTTIVQFIPILNDGGTFDVTSGQIVIDSTMTLAGTSSFTGTGPTNVTGGINGTASIAGTQLVLNGNLSGTGVLTLNGTMGWNSGSMSTSGGTTNVNPGATLNIGGTSDKFLSSRTLNNYGTVNWTEGRILFQNSGIFNNEPGGLFDITHDSSFTSTSVGGTFNNKGTFRKSGGGGTTTIVQFIAFNNQNAVVDILSGTLVVDSPMGTTGTNTFSGAGVLRVTGPLSGTTTIEGAFELGSGGSITGAGIVTVNGTLTWTAGVMNGSGSTDIAAGGTLHITGPADHFLDVRTINNAGTTTWDGGRILYQNNGHFINMDGALFETKHDSSFTSTSVGGRFTNFGTFRKSVGTTITTISQFIPFTSTDATFDIQSGALVIDSTITLGGTTDFPGAGISRVTGTINGTGTVTGRLELVNGTISGTGTVTVNGILDWVSGTMNTSGGITAIGSNGVLNITSTANHFLQSRTLQNVGTVNWNGGNVYFQNNGVFNNQTGGIFNAQVDNSFTSSSVGGDFINGGTFNKFTPGTISMNFVDFVNSGTLAAQAGTLHFAKSFTQTAGTTHVNGRVESTTAVNIQGGVVTGNGTFAANITNSGGDVQPGNSPDTFTIEGNYTQGAGGALTVEIDGALLYDRLSITGIFNAGGTLNIVSPYSPADGEQFQIMTFGSRNGDFAVKTGLNVGGGKSYAPVYGANELRLTAVNDSANLYVSQTDAPDPVNEGDQLTYTITITNGAATGATGVTLTDTLPTEVTHVSTTTTHGNCNGSTTINCAIGSLAAGESATVDIVVTANQSGTITNTADVAQNEPDPNQTNNTFSETTTVNGTPVATDDGGTTSEEVPITIDVLANDTDPDNDVLTIDSFSQANNGSVDCQGANCTYTPTPGFSGTDSFIYTIKDPNGAMDTATVLITINGVNDPPVANDDGDMTSEDTPVTLNVLSNDSDPDGGSVFLTGHTQGLNGSVNCDGAGNCTYTPNPNYNGGDSFSYTITDGQDTASATVLIAISALNDEPVANQDTLSTDQDTPAVVNVLLNDTDADGDTLVVFDSTNGTKGSVTCEANGDCTYSPSPGESGSDSFTYTIADFNDGSATGTVLVNINPVNDPPIATPDSAATNENTPVAIDVLGNDSDPENDLFVLSSFTQPSNGTVTCTGNTCTYTPDVNFEGIDEFKYNITDSSNNVATGTVTVTVIGANEPPVAVDDSASGFDVIHINVLGNDSDEDGDSLTVISHSEAETGQVSCSESDCTYWPKRGFRGSDNFTYTISDGAAMSTATVRIEVTRNDCPSTIVLTDPPSAGRAPSSGTLRWTPTAGAEFYNVYLGLAGSGCAQRYRRVEEPFADYANLLDGAEYEWRVEAVGTGCGIVSSACSRFTIGSSCVLPEAPEASVVAEATSGQTYTIEWNSVADGLQYDVEEADNRDFIGAATTRVTGLSAQFTHTVSQRAQAWFYRVRAAGCDLGPYSLPVRIVIIPLPQTIERHPQFTVPVGSEQILVQSLFIPGNGTSNQEFSIETDKPWLRVVPNRGLLPPSGFLVQIFADPKGQPNGTVTGTVIITLTPTASLGAVQTNATSTSSIPISINLVTPVFPVTTPPATPDNAMIIPTVGHIDGGAGSLWQSDVRVTNTSAATVKYQLTFMPSVVTADQKIQTTTIDVQPGVTTALDDIVRNWFGHGSLGDAAIGFLKIVPMNNTSARTVASSRTYNLTPNGTLGQFIPAISFNKFVGKAAANAAPPVLSLQQIAQSAFYRTNVGIVEASNKPASVLLTVFDIAGNSLKEIPISLAAGELKQLNGILAQNAISLDDGRIEVRVVSGDGKVTAYASTLDNKTNDPLLVSATELDEKTSTKYVLPGAADINTGPASWRTDMRIFNNGTEPQLASVVLHTEGGETVERSIVVAPREVKVLDGVIRNLFDRVAVGGAVHVSTATASKLVVTGRTYNQLLSGGTYGLYVPAVTPDEATGNGERTLHIPQVEDSSRYRTNIGVAEVSGKPATIELSVVLPDSKVTPTVEIDLAPNEFRQFVGLLRTLGLGDVYNARVTVRVVEGEGRVTAYGSINDAVTHDPTYVPAQ